LIGVIEERKNRLRKQEGMRRCLYRANEFWVWGNYALER